MKKLLIILALTGLAYASSAQVSRTNSTPSVTLAWNPVFGVAGYNLYYGAASGTYTGIVSAVTTSATVTPLVRGTTYFFAATAFSSNGLESVYSSEVSYAVPTLPGTPTNLVVRVNSP